MYVIVREFEPQYWSCVQYWHFFLCLIVTSLSAVSLPKHNASNFWTEHITQESMDSSDDEFFDAQG